MKTESVGTSYLALPDGAGPLPGVVVIHEASGLNDNIRGICGRFAGEGYAALGVDLFAGRNRFVDTNQRAGRGRDRRQGRPQRQRGQATRGRQQDGGAYRRYRDPSYQNASTRRKPAKMCLYRLLCPTPPYIQDLAMTRAAAEANDLATSTNDPKSAGRNRFGT